jgi:hypothetical protein
METTAGWRYCEGNVLNAYLVSCELINIFHTESNCPDLFVV